MSKNIFEPYSTEKRLQAMKFLDKSITNGKPNYLKVAKETGITKPTLKRWWTKHQLERQKELKIRLEEAIASILERIEKLAQETNNLKELAPVVKMLSELFQQFDEENGDINAWG